MQIGNSFQVSALSLLRPLPQADAQGTQASGGAVTAQAGGWGRRRDADRAEGQGSDDSRMQNRMQRLSAMLQRLTEANPDAQGASYAAIVLGGQGGAVAVASTNGPGQSGDTLVIQAQEIADISTGDGNDSISLQGSRVTGVYSGGGSDAVAIVGTFVSGIHLGQSAPSALTPPPAALPDPNTGGSPVPPVPIPPVDQPPVAATPVNVPPLAVPPIAVPDVPVATTAAAIPVPVDTLAGSNGTDTLAGGAAPREVDTSGTATGPGVVAQAPTVVPGNDALSIAAYLIRDISTGAGNDAVALAGVAVGDVNTGAGNDTISVKAVAVAGINGGDGNDTITVDAGIGAAGLSAAEGWFGLAAAPAPASAATTATASAAVTATPTPATTASPATSTATAKALAAYADVNGGAGNDVINVRTGSVLAVAGGQGDDTINASGGTVALVYGAGDGKDTVNVAAGAQVVLQISPDVASYSVEFGQDSMTVKMGEGSVTFKGIGAGTVGIKQGDGGMALISQPSSQNALNFSI